MWVIRWPNWPCSATNGILIKILKEISERKKDSLLLALMGFLFFDKRWGLQKTPDYGIIPTTMTIQGGSHYGNMRGNNNEPGTLWA
jgi:hypothetical protein